MADEELTEGQEQSQEDSRPDGLPENFKDVSALAKAHKDTQGELTQTKQELAALSEQLSELVEERSQQQYYDPNQDPILSAYEQAVEMGDTRAQLAMQAAIARSAVDAALKAQSNDPKAEQRAASQNSMYAALVEQQLAAAYGDEWTELRDEVGDLLEENPQLVPEDANLDQAVSGLTFAAEVVKARKVNAQQKTLAEQQRQEKKMAQGLTGASSGTPEEKAEAREVLKQILANAGRYGYEST